MEGKEARAGGPVVDFTHLQLNFSSCLIFNRLWAKFAPNHSRPIFISIIVIFFATIIRAIIHIYQYVQATPVQEVNRKDALEVEEKAYPPSPTQEKKDARSRKVKWLLVL